MICRWHRPKCLHFHTVFSEIGQIIIWHPPPPLLAFEMHLRDVTFTSNKFLKTGSQELLLYSELRHGPEFD